METTIRYYLRTRQTGKLRGQGAWSRPTHVDFRCTVAPPANETVKIIPADTAYNSYFGWSTAISTDGKTVIIGAYLDNSPKTDAGAAYIFVRTGALWSQQAKLVASDAAINDALGRSVDISDDGNTAIVGVYQDDDRGSNSGSAYVFERQGTSWRQQAKLTASDGAKDDFFGYAVSVSGDGNTVFVGSPQDDDKGSASGSGYIYIRDVDTWAVQGKFVPSELKASDMFGAAADLSFDGNTLIVGAYRGSYTYLNQGSAYVFTRTGTTWKKTAVLKPSDPSYGANFGQAIKITSDGLTVLIGAYKDKSSRGAVYVYRFENAALVMKQKLTASDGGGGDQFGISVATTSDTEYFLIGAMLDSAPLSASGSAYLFKKAGEVWLQCNKLVASDALKNDNFGRAVALSGTGDTAIITATGLATITASVYVFN